MQSIMLWWRSLSATDRALPAKIRELVTSCEDTFSSEHEAWASTSMSTKILTQEAQEAKGENDDAVIDVASSG